MILRHVEEFVRKRSNKLVKRWNLQPSLDNIIFDKPGRVGDVAEVPGLEASNNVGLKQGSECWRCVHQGGSEKEQILSLIHI